MEKRIVSKKSEEMLRKEWKKYSNRLVKNYEISFKKLDFEVLMKNLNSFLKNKYYVKKINNSPSVLCRLYIAMMYCRSYDTYKSKSMRASKIENECMLMEQYIEYFLRTKDLEYLRDDVAGMVQGKIIFNEIIKERKAMKKGEMKQISPHGREIYNPNYEE